jgi:spoIIIJ-associated protein
VAVREAADTPQREDDVMAEGMTLEEQGAIGKTFLEGLTSAFGLPASVEVRLLDEETVELAVDAEDPATLGILVGPRGATLAALQEVTRTAVQAKCPSRTDRILVDVARYRERRAKALSEFTATLAAEVVSSGEERRLEPMSPADRKVVHDAATSIDGVATRSEGEDPDRFVVISPA